MGRVRARATVPGRALVPVRGPTTNTTTEPASVRVVSGGEMTEDLMDLARRAVAVVPIEQWPDWTPVVAACGRGILLDERTIVFENGDFMTRRQFPDAIPLLDTPAGLGSLLAVVREAWGDGSICAADMQGYDGIDWMVAIPTGKETDPHGVAWFIGDTEAEALVTALEAAP